MTTSRVVPVVIAHRGASGYRPEHTRAAYELAFALGVDAVEPDIVASSDGVLVIRHENEISRTTDVASRPEFAARRTTKSVDGKQLTGWFTEDFTWAELSTLLTIERLPGIRPDNTAFDRTEGILRLEDLLGMLGTRSTGLVVELKHATYFAALGLDLGELLAEALVAAGWHDSDRLTVESFEVSALSRIRARGIRARYVYLVRAWGAPADRPDLPYALSLEDAGLAALSTQVDGISVNKVLLFAAEAAAVPAPNDLVDRAHAVGLSVYAWTLRAENRFLLPAHRRQGGENVIGDWETEFALIFSMGIDGVFTDHPDLAIGARDLAMLPG